MTQKPKEECVYSEFIVFIEWLAMLHAPKGSMKIRTRHKIIRKSSWTLERTISEVKAKLN